MTSFAASATGAGITLVGEIVDLDSRSGSDLSSMSVRWLGVTVGPTGAFRTVRSDPGPAGDHGRPGAPSADTAGHPTASPDGAAHHGATPDSPADGGAAGDGVAGGWGSGAFLASAMRAADGGGASFIPPQRSGDDPRRSDRPDQDRRPGRRGLTGSIRRLIDGPQGRHRRTHH
ncbi:hypothetical protein [Actinocatenispora comari]|uniref:Uncharacterized protein n=1 Tax=Actinocatenispora comari TaxID=2807577 RepID=A0A8J4AHS0_9ACTN|nr:hypothetical protein [Actinocatenispora comari]GIL30810.1 hypothetical protein NUM_60640 [Actinocatenispora comari]